MGSSATIGGIQRGGRPVTSTNSTPAAIEPVDDGGRPRGDPVVGVEQRAVDVRGDEPGCLHQTSLGGPGGPDRDDALRCGPVAPEPTTSDARRGR